MDSTGKDLTDAPAIAEEGQWALYADALPEKHREFYLGQFKRIDAARTLGLSWNWAAWLFTFSWLRYRRMRGYALAYFFVSTPVLLFLLLLTQTDKCAAEVVRTMFPIVLLVLLVAGYVVPPLLANRLYFRFVRKQIALAQRLESGTEAREQRIRSRLGTAADWGSWVLMTGILVLTVWRAGSMGYQMRSAVSQVIIAGSVYRNAANQFFLDRGRLPGSLEEIGGYAGPHRCVKGITLKQDGSIHVVAGFPPLDGQSIVITPIVRGGDISWTCTGGDIPAKYRPASCR